MADSYYLRLTIVYPQNRDRSRKWDVNYYQLTIATTLTTTATFTTANNFHPDSANARTG